MFVCLVFNACTECFYFIYIMVTGQTSTVRKAGIKEPDHGKYNWSNAVYASYLEKNPFNFILN